MKDESRTVTLQMCLDSTWEGWINAFWVALLWMLALLGYPSLCIWLVWAKNGW